MGVCWTFGGWRVKTEGGSGGHLAFIERVRQREGVFVLLLVWGVSLRVRKKGQKREREKYVF